MKNLLKNFPDGQTSVWEKNMGNFSVEGKSFRNEVIANSRISDASFDNCDFECASLEHLDLQNCSFNNCNLAGAVIDHVEGGQFNNCIVSSELIKNSDSQFNNCVEAAQSVTRKKMRKLNAEMDAIESPRIRYT